MILTGENRRTRRKICPGAILSTINPTLTGLWWYPMFRVERPATKGLSHGTVAAVCRIYSSYTVFDYLNVCTMIRNIAKEERSSLAQQ
jgi:hypothetical protein